MGVFSSLVTLLSVTGGAFYVLGREGLVRWSHRAGVALGASVARTRRSRMDVQQRLIETQTPEQREASSRLQQNMWRFRLVMNEVAMVRSLSPRLLHRGNFGFTDDELFEALGVAPPQKTAKEQQMSAHMTRQLEMEGQAISNPAMFPFAGVHGTTADTELVPAAVSAPVSSPHFVEASHAATTTRAPASAPTGSDGSPGPSLPTATAAATGVAAASTAASASSLSPAASAPPIDTAEIEALEPHLRQFHWSQWDEESSAVAADGAVRPARRQPGGSGSSSER